MTDEEMFGPVPTGRDPEFVLVLEGGDPDSLDAAWAEAEAALPEGLTFSLARAVRPVLEGASPTYYATASRPWTTGRVEFQVSGPTPAAALRALAAQLREAKG